MTETVALRARAGRDRRPVWEEPPTRIGQGFKAAFLTLLVLSVLFPLWVILVTSLSSRETLAEAGGIVVIPRGIDTVGLRDDLRRWGGHPGVVDQHAGHRHRQRARLTVTVLAAYGLSRPGSVGYRWLLIYFLVPFLVYPPLVPKYLVVTGLGLKDTIWALILPPAISVFNLVVVRGFFQAIPQELMDSARVDGASHFRTLAQIVLPLSRAVIAVVGLFYAVSYWNVWFDALLFIDRNDMYPIQRVLQSYLLAGQAPHTSRRQHRGAHAAYRGDQDGGGRAHRRPDRRGLSVHPAALHQGCADRCREGLTVPPGRAGSTAAPARVRQWAVVSTLAVRGLTRRFGALVVLDDVRFQLDAGQVAVVRRAERLRQDHPAALRRRGGPPRRG